jgi:hypothetical protein
MKTFLGLLLFFIVVLALAWYLLTTSFTNSYNKEAAKYKERVGTKIVLNKDTLLILDYSMLNDNFKLSNGQEISIELVKKMPIIK